MTNKINFTIEDILSRIVTDEKFRNEFKELLLKFYQPITLKELIDIANNNIKKGGEK